jgi:hypothetical protein
LIGVIEHHSIYSPENIFQTEAESWISRESPLEVSPQVLFAYDLPVGHAQKPGGDRGSQLHRILIVRNNPIQVMRIPRGNPVFRQPPGLISRQKGFSITAGSQRQQLS